MKSSEPVPSQAERAKADRVVQEASEESFPASDAPGWIGDAPAKPQPARPPRKPPARGTARGKPR